jgi:hypothetical protein
MLLSLRVQNYVSHVVAVYVFHLKIWCTFLNSRLPVHTHLIPHGIWHSSAWATVDTFSERWRSMTGDHLETVM